MRIAGRGGSGSHARARRSADRTGCGASNLSARGNYCHAGVPLEFSRGKPFEHLRRRIGSGSPSRMCGIAGIFSEVSRDPGVVGAMASALAHRGPDDEGIWVDPEAGVAFGHRAPRGRRPVARRPSADALRATAATCSIFNGEIYNLADLRAARARRGARRLARPFDTETLLAGDRRLGPRAALGRAWACSRWRSGIGGPGALLLARDRFGEKPLYYGRAGGDFVFGSELKALRAHPDSKPQIDRRALALFMRRGYVPAPLSIYRGVSKLTPGHPELTAERRAQRRAEPPAAA